VADASLRTFALPEMIRLSAALRVCTVGSTSTEAAADAVVREVFDAFVDGDGVHECVLVRYYQTLAYAELPEELQEFARGALTEQPWSELPCLTLLATVGVEPAWNDRRLSQSHCCIPLPSAETVDRSPMIAQLISQLGLELSALIEPDPAVIVDLDQKQYNVFHVPDALGSPYVPAQDDFVVPYDVRSALGFGGMLPTGDMFALVLFSRAPVSRETADLFRTVALSVKVGVLAVSGATFEPSGPAA